MSLLATFLQPNSSLLCTIRTSLVRSKKPFDENWGLLQLQNSSWWHIKARHQLLLQLWLQWQQPNKSCWLQLVQEMPGSRNCFYTDWVMRSACNYTQGSRPFNQLRKDHLCARVAITSYKTCHSNKEIEENYIILLL
jgi:hypothetical protein